MSDFDDALRSAREREQQVANEATAAAQQKQTADQAAKSDRVSRVDAFIARQREAGFPTVVSVDIHHMVERRTGGLFRQKVEYTDQPDTYVGWSIHKHEYTSEVWGNPTRTEERLLLVDGRIMRHRDYNSVDFWSVSDMPASFTRELDGLVGHP